MKNSSLLFRSLAIILILAGTAHLFTYASHNRNDLLNNEQVPDSITEMLHDTNPTQGTQEKENEHQAEVSKSKNNPTDYLSDQWKVVYNSTDFKGAIIYEIKKEGKVFKAYTYQYEDENGYQQAAEGAQALLIKSFDGAQGIGIYQMEYEGEQYDVECKIKKVDENTFQLNYNTYGYSDVETWKRQ